MTGNLTIVIAARNAAATIERAVGSAAAESACPLVLVDDHCTDDTVARARRVAGGRLRVVPAPAPGGVTVARQAGLDAVETEFATWLDADDEWLPGRAGRFVEALQGGADVVTEAIELFDGATGERLRRLTIPEFVRREVVPARLFERNYLPGDTQVAFRPGLFREAGGYDPALSVAESFDLLLRAVARGAKFAYGREAGYRMYAYPGSASRHLARQRAALAGALGKHDYENVRRLCLAAGEPPRVAAWVLVSMALYREDPGRALGFVDEASPPVADPLVVLEPTGPVPEPEGWRRSFARGTCLLMLGRSEEAQEALRSAEAWVPTAEGANNLGAALARLGRPAEAKDCWRLALDRFEGFADARENLAGGNLQITTHPLRRQASRAEYARLV